VLVPSANLVAPPRHLDEWFAAFALQAHEAWTSRSTPAGLERGDAACEQVASQRLGQLLGLAEAGVLGWGRSARYPAGDQDGGDRDARRDVAVSQPTVSKDGASGSTPSDGTAPGSGESDKALVGGRDRRSCGIGAEPTLAWPRATAAAGRSTTQPAEPGRGGRVRWGRAVVASSTRRCCRRTRSV